MVTCVTTRQKKKNSVIYLCKLSRAIKITTNIVTTVSIIVSIKLIFFTLQLQINRLEKVWLHV